MKKQNAFFAVFSLVVVVFLFLAPYFILPRAYSGRDDWIKTAPPSAVFIELWEIDTFEGGSASRAKFLEKAAYLFQQESIANYVLVRSLDLNQAKQMLANGAKPDMISYGIGAGELILPLAYELKADNVRGEIVSSGTYNGKLFAAGWTMGGYVLCSKESFNFLNKPSIYYGYNYNAPNLAVTEYKHLLIKEPQTQYGAYEKFFGAENQILLGTQRDFYRLNNKVANGAIANINYMYLDRFTDLIQYMSITSENQKQREVAQNFIDYVTGHKIQKRLDNIGMFTVNGDTIYLNTKYQDFETALSKKVNVLNVFTPAIKVNELREG